MDYWRFKFWQCYEMVLEVFSLLCNNKFSVGGPDGKNEPRQNKKIERQKNYVCVENQIAEHR